LVNVTDRESLQNWLEGKPRDVLDTIAARSALRVYPYAMVGIFERKSRKIDLTIIAGRALLISAVAAYSPTAEIRRAAASASAAAAAASASAAAAAADASAASAAASSFAAAAADASDASFWKEVSKDLTAFEEGTDVSAVLGTPLWQSANPFEELWQAKQTFLDERPENWSFWIDWYQRFLDGRPQNWEMLEEVALIDPEDWDKGTAHVNGLIAEIQARYDKDENVTLSPAETVSQVEAVNMIARVTLNRDSLVVSIAGVLDQITQYRELVRGNNQMELSTREDLFDFLDELSNQLSELLSQLPTDVGAIASESSEQYVRWLTKFRLFLKSKALKYVDPENVAEAIVPTGIILGSTGIGAMLGQPLAGAAVGGLITNHMKPVKAAEAILKPDGEGE